jgi:hypothetical protein
MIRRARRPPPIDGLRRLLHPAAAAGIGVVLVACGAGTGDQTTDAPDPPPAGTTPQQGDPGSERIGVQDHVTIEVIDP